MDGNNALIYRTFEVEQDFVEVCCVGGGKPNAIST
jgi:hypothetical protein